MRPLAVLRWGATAAQVGGVFLLSSRIVPAGEAFGILLAGSTAYMVAAGVARDWPVLVLNAAFTASNILGICRWAN